MADLEGPMAGTGVPFADAGDCLADRGSSPVDTGPPCWHYPEWKTCLVRGLGHIVTDHMADTGGAMPIGRPSGRRREPFSKYKTP